jgi:PAB-dependent poly(A)-specific ribonuclease subunit 2
LCEQGVVFVGHGLKKDFQMSNLVVPASQIQDTVEIYHLPNQRFMSLKFLATHVLGLSVQVLNNISVFFVCVDMFSCS